MASIGYFLSSEQSGPKELVEQARRAEQAGFESNLDISPFGYLSRFSDRWLHVPVAATTARAARAPQHADFKYVLDCRCCSTLSSCPVVIATRLGKDFPCDVATRLASSSKLSSEGAAPLLG